jgi:hypothetical protein
MVRGIENLYVGGSIPELGFELAEHYLKDRLGLQNQPILLQ